MDILMLFAYVAIILACSTYVVQTLRGGKCKCKK